jgi:ABC-2 type transport system permease protein
MPSRRILVVAAREYLTRIKTKGFWIGTVTLPILMLAAIMLPAVFMTTARITHRTVVVDETGRVADTLVARLAEGRGLKGGSFEGRAAEFEAQVEEPARDRTSQREELNRRVVEGEIDSWIWISTEGLAENRVEYYAESVSSFLTQALIQSALTDVVREVRVREAGYDPEEVGALLRRVNLKTVRVSEEGERAERAEAGFILAYFMGLLLYMLLVLYGQQVLLGVLEEKTSRVVEIVLSTLRPFELMMGKLVGICLVGLTQLAIWLGTAALLTAPAVLASLATLPENFQVPSVSPWLMFNLVIFFLLGYFVFSTFYAAIGAAFNNVQEAQQFAVVAVVFLIVPMMLMVVVINDPDSTLSVAMSLIPLFTPMLMLLRIAVKEPPLWQVLLSYGLTLGFAVVMVWICARIYRVGILMYGKKPTLGEIWRWLRHA